MLLARANAHAHPCNTTLTHHAHTGQVMLLAPLLVLTLADPMATPSPQLLEQTARDPDAPTRPGLGPGAARDSGPTAVPATADRIVVPGPGGLP